MSNALKCDRCGKLYEMYGGIQLVKHGNSYCRFEVAGNCGYQKYDLCEDCMKPAGEDKKPEEKQAEVKTKEDEILENTYNSMYDFE